MHIMVTMAVRKRKRNYSESDAELSARLSRTAAARWKGKSEKARSAVAASIAKIRWDAVRASRAAANEAAA